MYCIKCGVELADSEKCCPLCGTRVYHPQLKQGRGERLFPAFQPEREPVSAPIVLSLITAMCVVVIALVLVIDLKTKGRVVWSGYAVGGLLLAYEMIVLPFWFRKPNPVVFVPCAFAATAGYLLYICLKTGGRWFLTLALPTVGMAALISTTVVTLLRYVRGGRAFIIGGATMASGACMMVLEMLICITRGGRIRFVWSPYPATVLFLMGLFVIILGVCKTVRRRLKKKFFV